MRWEQKVQVASHSDVGFRRRNNQDSFAVMLSPDAETFQARGHLFIVADGMGGHAVGEMASQIAVETVPHVYFKNRTDDMPTALNAAILDANTAVHEKGSQNLDFHRMGTTVVVLTLGPAGAFAGHVGDSRLYRVRREQIDQLTFDHSLEWELIRRGHLKSNQQLLPDMKHVITRSIGPESEVEPEVEGPFPVWPGDTFLLCSDGLTGLVKDAEIGAIVKHLPPKEACRMLVNLANQRGGPDNITVVIAQVGPLPEGVAPRPEEVTEPPAEADPFGWLWQGGLWAAALTFGVGVVHSMLQETGRTPGIVLATLSLIAFIVVLILWRRHARSRVGEPLEKSESTVLSRAHRTASAKLTPEFFVALAKCESDMQHIAAAEQWPLDSAAHQSASAAAKAALDNKQRPEALREFAKSIDLLMTAWQQHRKTVAARDAEAKEQEAKRETARGQ
ncbi:MAG: protein phosphatase [Planctomycetota bacterium]|nr:MAG: protein phosphatase [Planctomycetota bacterium]